MEANRSDKDKSPQNKLITVSSQENLYSLKSEDLPNASFIENQKELELWCKSIPNEAIDINYSYLADTIKYRENHLSLVDTITNRLGRIYKEWFDTLAIADLLPNSKI